MIHYDIWHRKMLNRTQMNRYMFKFEFTRLTPPQPADRPDWKKPQARIKPDLEPVWESSWDWLVGQKTGERNGRGLTSIESGDLGSEEEWQGIRAGYELARQPDENLPALLEALSSNEAGYDEPRRYSDNGQIWRDDACARNAAHGLVAIGKPAVPGLLKTISGGSPRAQKHAAFALGEIGDKSATQGLTQALRNPEVHVRVAAIEALGMLPPSRKSIQSALTALKDPASEVRFDATLSLMRLTSQTSKTLQKMCVGELSEALYDTNRYVSGYAVEALERIGTSEALQALLPFMRTARWCAHTDNRRPF